MTGLRHSHPSYPDGSVHHAWVYDGERARMGQKWYVCRECGVRAIHLDDFIDLGSVEPSRADVLDKIAQYMEEKLDPQLE